MALQNPTFAAGASGAMPRSARGLLLQLLRSLLASPGALHLRLRERAELERARDQLYSLPDRQLHDIGLGRSEILFATRLGRSLERRRRNLG